MVRLLDGIERLERFSQDGNSLR